MGVKATARSYPLPAGSDYVRNGPAEMDALAEAIAGDMGENGVISATAGITAASGFTLGSVRGIKVGRLALLSIQLTKATAALGPATATGNLADTTAATLAGAWAPHPGMTIGLRVPWEAAVGGYGGGARLTSAGLLVIVDAYPTATIAIGDVVTFTACYALAA